MPLSATKVKNVKPAEKPIKLSDGGGLYLFVKPMGSKLWRMNYRHLGRQKTASFGPYPSVSLAEAREHREEAKRVLRSGIDPVEHAHATKEAAAKALRAQEDVTTPTFEALSLSYIAKRTREKASPKTLEKYDWLHRLTLPEVGHLNPMEVEPPDIRPLLLRLEMENKLDTAQRTRTYIGQVMRHGIAAGLASRDPSPDLRGLVASPKTRNHAAIKDPKLFGEFLNTCDEYTGNPVTVLAMQIAPLVALRSEELRGGTWDEIDFDAAIWRVPQNRMKGDCPGDHLVPLSKQALAHLRKLHLPGLYAMYSVRRYFGMSRAAGGDHFDQSFRDMPMVKEGIFRFTNNGMYLYAFLLFWAIAVGFGSTAALVVAAFSHAYIWVHFYATEKPDMAYLYGSGNP